LKTSKEGAVDYEEEAAMYDPLSWKTDTLYGNLLAGFTAP
jgi:hypothetical protein